MISPARTKYIINEESQVKLHTLFEQEIAQAVEKHKYDLSHPHYIHAGISMRELAAKGYYNRDGEVFEELKAVVQLNPNARWTTTKQDGSTIIVPSKGTSLDTQQQLLVLGYYASLVTQPEQWKKFNRYGFANIHDFIGCLGAELLNLSAYKQSRSIIWGDEPIFHEMNLDSSSDFISLTTVNYSPQITLSPTQARVSYRPVEKNSKSTELPMSDFIFPAIFYLHKKLGVQKLERLQSEIQKENDFQSKDDVKFYYQMQSSRFEHSLPEDIAGLTLNEENARKLILNTINLEKSKEPSLINETKKLLKEIIEEDKRN